jgi:hypothetical protein
MTYDPDRVDAKINGVTLTIIDSTGTYDYQWSEFAVMRGDDGLLYVGDTSGCSCNSFTENLCEDDVTLVASWQEAAEKCKEWIGTAYMDESEKRGGMDLIERLAQSRPPAVES